MNLQLTLIGETERPGYQQLSMARESITNLDWIADDAEIRNLLALDILDYLPASQVDETLTHWVSKLRKNGTITVGGVDFYDVSRRLYLDDLSINEANLFLFGSQTIPIMFRKSASGISCVVDKLKSLGLTITNKSLIDSVYTITAKRS